MRPTILLTPDAEDGRYVLKAPYARAVADAGGLPLIAPYDAPVDALLAVAAGLVVTGGAFDIDPAAYGEARTEKCGPVKEERPRFERALLEAALARDLPVLGICGGMQLLAVVRGGTLHQDIAAEIPGAGPHEQRTPRHEPAHPIRVEPGSRLARAVGGARAAVNSTHHQAVKAQGRGLVVTARAEDGLIEAIEDPSARFCVGVQWHPELLGESAPWNRSLFAQLVEAAR